MVAALCSDPYDDFLEQVFDGRFFIRRMTCLRIVTLICCTKLAYIGPGTDAKYVLDVGAICVTE
uniref:Uncharacterized protein n=1 Tax=Anopheles albimanus TaxID=7167 RepID=A0A182FPL4_ANOAL